MTNSLNREMIEAFVRLFYSKVRRDEILGSIFDKVIGEHWEHHMQTLTDFWASLFLGVRTYHGNPMGAHIAIGNLDKDLFERWLSIFEETASTAFPPQIAKEFIIKAHNISRSLQLGIKNAYGDGHRS